MIKINKYRTKIKKSVEVQIMDSENKEVYTIVIPSGTEVLINESEAKKTMLINYNGELLAI